MKTKKTVLEFVVVEKVDREKFLSVLMKNIIVAKNKFPELYNWEKSDVLTLFRYFVESLENDTFSRHNHAIKWTVKELKLGNDRKTINTIMKVGKNEHD